MRPRYHGERMNGPQERNKTALARARSAAMTVTLVMVALILAFFPFVPVHFLRKRDHERQDQEISRDLDE